MPIGRMSVANMYRLVIYYILYIYIYVYIIYKHASFYCAFQILFIFPKKIEGLWQRCIEQVFWHHFSNIICLLHFSVSYFGNSYNISNLFIIVIFVVMICDLL